MIVTYDAQLLVNVTIGRSERGRVWYCYSYISGVWDVTDHHYLAEDVIVDAPNEEVQRWEIYLWTLGKEIF